MTAAISVSDSCLPNGAIAVPCLPLSTMSMCPSFGPFTTFEPTSGGNAGGMPPAFPPLVGSKVVNGPKEGHMDIVLNGKQGTAMAPFGKQLSDTEIAAVISYERSTWGNK